ncbi:GNAT family N-acetyltransferase [Flavisphingomonas formosensis]|uniref:GNAT family N-acetyltransferase n=1 Tax=Flavisphingomonas formosensis TaxID=861534 RepID=UPI0012F7F75A|nr:GNAT family N-acetyltransferase [Sphingomonas formosensis]
MIPILTTARLTLRSPNPDDLEASAAMWGDPAVYAMIGGRSFAREEVWQRLLRYIGHWQTVGYGSWTVIETASGRYAGEVGLMDSRRASEPSFEGTPEAGWALAPWAHGRGFAGEAVGAMLDWADEQGIARTVCIIDAANTASVRVAARVGYRFLATARYRDALVDLYERLRPVTA